MSDGYYEYLMWRMSVCESAKELNKLAHLRVALFVDGG